jgi:hypothetical protein
MSWTSVEDNLYAASKLLTPSVNFVIADQNGAELKTPYCVINVIMHDQIGRESEHNYVVEATPTTPCSLVAEIHETFETTVRFIFIGKANITTEASAQNQAYSFMSRLKSSTARYYFAQNNLSIMRINPLRPAPVTKETDRYVGYTVEVVFAYCLKTTETTDWFDTVNVVSGKLTGSVIDPFIIDEFTIPS